MTITKTVHLGFAVGSGYAVEIPLAHTFVSGQTQQSGKTTALRAIVDRSGRRALAFITKRGEAFEGRRIRPYLPREGEQPIHWRMVETLLASALEQRALKFERLQLIQASKGARSLEDVQANVRRLRTKSKGNRNEDIYTLLDEYLELVLPQMRALRASDVLDLQPGLNVMDLSGIAGQTQAMVMRAALERINHHETDVLTVLPEAWEFAPRDRQTPARPEAEAMARKGAAPQVQNFLMVDSQDIAGVSPVVRQACSVWLIGVQRELNELKRAVQMMPAGVKRPKADEVATLELGQFFVCWGTHAIKTYVQPAWMDAAMAEQVAFGTVTINQVQRQQTSIERESAAVARRFGIKEETVTKDEAAQLTRENEQLKADNADLRRRLEALEAKQHDGTAATGADPGRQAKDRGPAIQAEPTVSRTVSTHGPRTFTAQESFDNEAVYQAFKARLIEEVPAILKIALERPSIEIAVSRPVLTFEEHSLKWRIVRLLADGFFRDERKSPSQVRAALKRTGPDANTANIGRALDDFTRSGVFTDEGSGYLAVPGIVVNVDEK